jgi:hypothetical protein
MNVLDLKNDEDEDKLINQKNPLFLSYNSWIGLKIMLPNDE